MENITPAKKRNTIWRFAIGTFPSLTPWQQQICLIYTSTIYITYLIPIRLHHHVCFDNGLTLVNQFPLTSFPLLVLRENCNVDKWPKAMSRTTSDQKLLTDKRPYRWGQISHGGENSMWHWPGGSFASGYCRPTITVIFPDTTTTILTDILQVNLGQLVPPWELQMPK